jgi:predicted transcriptional regulator
MKMNIDEIKARDAASGVLWFTGPESFNSLAARDRRVLLAEIERLGATVDAYEAARAHDVDEKNWLRGERERLRAALRHALAFMYDDGGSRIVPEHVIETVRAALPDYADAGAA